MFIHADFQSLVRLIKMKILLLNKTEKPDWFSYPKEFLKEINLGILDIGPWQFLTGEWLQVRHNGLKKRFPDRNLVPFARRLDTDDIACWEAEYPNVVRLVHDFAAPGWEAREQYPSFDDWYAVAKLEAETFDD